MSSVETRFKCPVCGGRALTGAHAGDLAETRWKCIGFKPDGGWCEYTAIGDEIAQHMEAVTVYDLPERTQ